MDRTFRATARLFLSAAALPALLVTHAPAAQAQGSIAAPSAPATLLPVKAVPEEGRVLFTLPRPDADGVAGRYIYASALRTGLGSADIRLDRGMLGGEQILAFRRIGKKVAVTFENSRFRATGDAAVRTGGRESFPFAVIAMLDIVSTGADGSLVVDMSTFLTRDQVGIAGALNRDGKGYRLAEALSAADAASLKAFPDNIEVDSIQTYVSDAPGPEATRIAPDARQLGFIVHHSFIRLPEPGFVTRRFDPRAPVGGPLIYDYGTTLGMPVAVQLASRFRLEKTDPTAARSPVKKPIVFYVDRAAPEPVRTALMEGVNYWSDAFEKAGFIGGFRAELLPEGADPLDVRYNVVNWTNRLTRGWSYGGGIQDPRTGEIIKGNVVLGALRIRQDIAIFEGLVGTAQNGTGGPNDPVRASLDRIRQLGAHEVGHAIGFSHNFAGSTQGRTSVMDYPGPRIGLQGGEIDLSDAYAKAGGAWDDFSVDWLYGDPAPGADPEAHARGKALAIKEKGLRFITDIDGRSPDTPSPWGSMWDDGPDPLENMKHIMAVRDVALARFGPQVILPDEPLSELRRKFVPIWLLHRYDIDAVGKLIGGIDYEYAVRGDNHPAPVPVPAATQRAAIDAMIDTLSATRLTVPERLVMLLSSPTTRLPDVQFNKEVLQNAGAAAFDPLVAADSAAQITLGSLLAPARLTRLLEQNRRNSAFPGLDDVLAPLQAKVVEARADAVGRRIAYRTLLAMAAAQQDPATSPDVAVALADRLQAIAAGLARGGKGADGVWARSIAKLLSDEDLLAKSLAKKGGAPDIPPGMPIGGGESEWFGNELDF